MNNDLKIQRVNLDGIHFLLISVNEKAKTVTAELISDKDITFIYAEKFDVPCNYLRAAVKKGIAYLNNNIPENNHLSEKNFVFACTRMNM